MVVSSFETVAGLSAATPYISLAFKTVSRHFRFLKSAISFQLKNIRRALGESMSFPTTGTSSSKVDSKTSRLKFIDQTFQKQKASGGSVGIFESQHHVWRPQRGLPERAVAILRGWLFDHFLHPYPTDTDKHLLATQTGLTRNQVSNWFINARVRVWKPMVEEIHMLETKGMAEIGGTAGKWDGKHSSEGATKSKSGPQMNGSDKQSACLVSGPSASLLFDEQNADAWNQEKRSRVDCHIPDNMNGSFVSFIPYQRNAVEYGGLGAVSLTLGLRQSAETAYQQEHQLRQFEGQMIHDFVG